MIVFLLFWGYIQNEKVEKHTKFIIKKIGTKSGGGDPMVVPVFTIIGMVLKVISFLKKIVVLFL